MAKFRHGFKAECERIAVELRAELDLGPQDRLEPVALADHLAIPALPLDEFRSSCEEAVNQLTIRDPRSFSAATIFCGTYRVIVYNPTHSAGRHANSVAHEFGHVLLEHDPGPVRTESGERHWSVEDEREADHLGATLLVPRAGIIPVMYRVKTMARAAAHFGVSEQLMQWRVNETGVALQMRRAAAKSLS